MTEIPDQADFVDRTPDERLLGEDAANLPPEIGRPESMPLPSPAHRRIVGIGAAMTGLTLLLGVVLIAAGIGESLSNSLALGIAALAFGVLFVGTHWGWVHVAEITANSVENRRNNEVIDRRRQWLLTIRPYTRYEVTTSVDDDGSIRITRTAHRPVARGEHGFTFVAQVELEEVHSAEEPSAIVTERAELLRRQAAADTDRERKLFDVAADAYETALLDRDDEQQQRAARRAASEALSEQINANLRDPPLVE